MVFETMQIDELNSTEYEAWLDWKDYVDPDFEILKDSFPDKKNKEFYFTCPKCGESITDFEMNINNGRCPCCDSIIDDIPF